MITKPILFSTEMVDAILEGRKTQTRIVVTSRNSFFDGGPWSAGIPFDEMEWNSAFVDPGPSPAGNPGPYLKAVYSAQETSHRIYPRMFTGTILWVREAWQFSDDMDAPFLYRHQYQLDHLPEFHNSIKWRPSIFMPKAACRIFLKVMNVRVERVQNITPADSIAEGVRVIYGDSGNGLRVLGYDDYTVKPEDGFNTFFDPRESFESLWESINGRESWEANPWVWVYDFEITEKPEGWPS